MNHGLARGGGLAYRDATTWVVERVLSNRGFVRDPIQLSVSASSILNVDVIDTWPVWIQAVAAAVTAIGLVAAGIWALIRFRGNRVFIRRCSIDLDCKVVTLHGRTAIHVNVTMKNCGDSGVTFDETDIAGVEVWPIDDRSWRSQQDGSRIQWYSDEDDDEDKDWEKEIWENKDEKMREDLLMDCGGRYLPVSIEPGQDIVRSCLFVMPQHWVAARVRCVLALGEELRPRWLATRVVTRPNLDGTVHFPQMLRLLERRRGGGIDDLWGRSSEPDL